MNNWVNLGIILIISRGILNGYLNGAKKSVCTFMGLIFFLLLSSVFSQAGVDYLSGKYEVEKKIAPVLLEHLPLVTPVVNTSFFVLEPNEKAIFAVNQMKLPFTYLEKLAKMIGERGEGLTANKVIVDVFSNVLLEAGVFFLFFLSFLLLLLVLKSLLSQPKQRKLLDGLIGAFFGGICYIIIAAVFLLVCVPFLPLWDNFITRDIATSSLVDVLLPLALLFGK